MSELIQKVKQKQRKIQDIQKEAERKSGRKEQILKQLESDHQVSSLVEAKKHLEELRKIKNENNQDLENLDKKLQEIISSAQTRANA